MAALRQKKTERGGAIDGVFIRAPRFRALWPDVEVLGRLAGEPVLVRQGRVIAATFHPELPDDPRLPRRFLDLALGEAATEGTPLAKQRVTC